MTNISSEDKYKLLELTSTAKGVLRKYIDVLKKKQFLNVEQIKSLKY